MSLEIPCVWLVRHAETTHPSVFHGAESDVELGQTGHRQAEALAEWFAPQRPTAILSSGMKRAIQTAQPIAQLCNLPHHVEPAFHERRVGELSGTSFAVDSGPWPETIREWSRGNTRYTTPGAESFDELQDRLFTAWRSVVQEYREDRLVIVAHGVVCKVLLLSLLPNYGVQRWKELGRVANGSVSELVQSPDGHWQAKRLLYVPETLERVHEVNAASLDIGPRLKSEA